MSKQRPLHPLLMKELEDALYVQFTIEGINPSVATEAAIKIVTSKMIAWGLLDP